MVPDNVTIAQAEGTEHVATEIINAFFLASLSITTLINLTLHEMSCNITLMSFHKST